MMRWLMICLLLGTSVVSGAEEDLPDLGPEWFEKLRDPATRAAALFEWKKRTSNPARPPDEEEFLAMNHEIMVFPCPQRGKKDAWAVVSPRDWHRGQRALVGLDDDEYETHPEEAARRRTWATAKRVREARSDPWQPGEPWFESASIFLVDASGKQLTDWFFLGVGVLGDFNGDRLIEVMEIERCRASTENKKMRTLDVVGIGPLDQDRPRFSEWYCNLRDRNVNPRDWLFEVRKNGGKLNLALVSRADGTVVTYRGVGARFEATELVPQRIHHLQEPRAGNRNASNKVLERLGITLHGVGTDDASELDAGIAPFRDPPKWDSVAPFSGIDFGDKLPREAAVALAEHNRDALHRSRFDVVSTGDPVPLPESGWVEFADDGGGWGTPSSTTWWLKPEGEAERWQIKDGHVIKAESLPRGRAAWAIALVHEMDRLRTVPKFPRVPMESSGMGSGDDFPMQRVRAFSAGVEPLRTTKGYQSPDLWSHIGGYFDRDLTSALAIVAVSSFPTGEAPIEIDLRQRCQRWLDPDNNEPVPPALLHLAVATLQKAGDPEALATLRKLCARLGEKTADERRLEALPEAIRANRKAINGAREDDARRAANRERNQLRNEQRELFEKLAGDRQHELRAPVAAVFEENSEENNVDP